MRVRVQPDYEDADAIGLGRLDAVGLDRRVGDELAAERVGPQREDPRAVDAVRSAEIERRVRAVQRDPPSALLDPGADRPLRVLRRSDVARVADEDAAARDRIGVLVVRLHSDAHVLVLGEQGQQLATGEIDVVVLPAGDEGDVDARAVRRAGQKSTRFRKPPSTVRMPPLM
jgi:hypothetical protein